MNRIIVLDSGPLGALANPNNSPLSARVRKWAHLRTIQDDLIVIPEIADYEVRRELIRNHLEKSVAELDFVRTMFKVIPLNGGQLKIAANLWAKARNMGRPAAADAALDGDMILVAQAHAAAELFPGYISTVIATTNTKHLDLFSDARLWSVIS